MDIGKKIKSFRVGKGLTQQDMAAKLNVSDNTFRNIENNKISPNLNTLERISKIFDISFILLFEDIHSSLINKNNNKHVNCSQHCAFIYLPEKAVEKYEKMLNDNSEYISLLKEKISFLENKIMTSGL